MVDLPVPKAEAKPSNPNDPGIPLQAWHAAWRVYTVAGYSVREAIKAAYWAGRAQAAADIRTQTMDFCMDGVGRHLVAECARIAEGGGEAAYPNASDLLKD